MDPHSLQPPARYRRGREGDQRRWTTGAATTAAAALGQKTGEPELLQTIRSKLF
jgi:hypothetical protein